MSSTPNPHSPNVSIDIDTGGSVNCFRRKSGRYYRCKIIEKRRNVGGGYEYYVHYFDSYRRNDEWVTAEQLDLETLLPNSETVDLEEQRQVQTAEYIRLRRKEIKIRYASPIMAQFRDCRILHVCEFCLTVKENGAQLKRHNKVCKHVDPPGHEIYRDGRLSVYQIDGATNYEYCLNLCNLGSMFSDMGCQLGTLEINMFYLLILRDKYGYNLVSYFSEAKNILESYDGSHFLTLPPYQRRGYASFMIALAYEHAKMENASGVKSECALSYYQKYWNWVCVRKAMKRCEGTDENAPSFEDLSRMTGMPPEVVQEIVNQPVRVEGNKCLYTVYAGISPKQDKGVIELDYIDCNQRNQIARCPDFDAEKITWAPPQFSITTRLCIFSILVLFYLLTLTNDRYNY